MLLGLLTKSWKALIAATMISYMLYLYKTVRKFFGEAVVGNQTILSDFFDAANSWSLSEHQQTISGRIV
jgi:hypothetical protein